MTFGLVLEFGLVTVQTNNLLDWLHLD